MKYKRSNYRKTESIEPPCRKTIYHSKEEAEDMIKYINATWVTREIKAYKCNICGFWHLTSRTE